MGTKREHRATQADTVMGMDAVPRPLHSPIKWWERRRNNFFIVIGAVIGGFLLNAVAGDVYDRIKPWKQVRTGSGSLPVGRGPRSIHLP